MKYYKVVNVTGWEEYYKENHIYPGDYYTEGSTVEEDATGIFAKDFKIVTKAAYNKQEGIVTKPRVKKVVKFKVGDYVEVIDPGSSCNKKGDFGYITEICIKDNDCRVSKTNDPNEMGNWVSFTGIKLSTQTKLKQVEMENYSIEGNKALKTALVEECGLKLHSSTTISDNKYFTSEDEPIGKVRGTRSKKAQHFVLPKDWDKAVAYVKEFNTSPKFKNGDYVVVVKNEHCSCNKVGDIGILRNVNTSSRTANVDVINSDRKTGNGHMFNELRLATPAEIKAATEPKFKMAGYDSVINKSAKTISFGCQTYTKAEVKLLLDAAKLCERVGYSAKVKASGFVVNETDILTTANLTKILAELK